MRVAIWLETTALGRTERCRTESAPYPETRGRVGMSRREAQVQPGHFPEKSCPNCHPVNPTEDKELQNRETARNRPEYCRIFPARAPLPDARQRNASLFLSSEA